MFVNYNDYELIYLVNEGEYKALKVLFNKYSCLIEMKAREIYPYGDKINDLIQEGKIILYNCIRNYSEEYGVSFYSYFLISLRRKFNKEKAFDYYQPILPFRDYSGVNSNVGRNILIRICKEHFEGDKLIQLLLDEHYIKNKSLFEMAEDYKIGYHKLIKKKAIILAYLKKNID